ERLGIALIARRRVPEYQIERPGETRRLPDVLHITVRGIETEEASKLPPGFGRISSAGLRMNRPVFAKRWAPAPFVSIRLMLSSGNVIGAGDRRLAVDRGGDAIQVDIERRCATPFIGVDVRHAR